MFDVTSFRLVLGVYIVHVLIFIKKIFTKFVQDKFLGLLKILIMIMLKMLENLCHVYFIKSDKKNVNYEKTAKITGSVFKKKIP